VIDFEYKSFCCADSLIVEGVSSPLKISLRFSDDEVERLLKLFRSFISELDSFRVFEPINGIFSGSFGLPYNKNSSLQLSSDSKLFLFVIS
jgi:hypothetical protein